MTSIAIGTVSPVSEATIQVPPGYQRAVSIGANWTMATSPYLIRFVMFGIASGGAAALSDDIAQTLEIAGRAPLNFGATVLLDGLSHAIIFVTAVTLFAMLRTNWPVRASLILIGGVWQMLLGMTKVLIAVHIFPQLGAEYLAADTALQRTLVAVATAAYGLHQGLQYMDSIGVVFLLTMIALLPASTGLPRLVRWLGLIVAVALVLPFDVTFVVVVLLVPIWQLRLGWWMKSQVPVGV